MSHTIDRAYCIYGACTNLAIADGVHVGGLWSLPTCANHVPETARKYQTVVTYRAVDDAHDNDAWAQATREGSPGA